MNRRLSAAIACCIGLLIALILLTTSVPWIQAATSETTNKPVLFPQRAPVPSSNKRRFITPLPILDRSMMTPTHKRLAQTVLTTLPSPCRTHLQNFYVLYEGARQRGLGGKTTIILDGTLPDEEFLALLVHECGHVTHGNLIGTGKSGTSDFSDGNDRFFADSPVVEFFGISWKTEHIMRRNAQTADFASGYAKTNAFEDFAETFAAYVLHRSLLQKRALDNTAIATKLAWMETHLPLPENALAISTYIASKTIPWDITKLPITL